MEDIGTALASVAALGDKFTGSKQLDLILRDNLQAAVRRLGYALETPGDSIQRISYLPAQIATVVIGINLRLYEQVVEAGSGGISLEELSARSNADPKLLVRIIRYLVALGNLDQNDQGNYTATPITTALATPVLRAGVINTCGLLAPTLMALPRFLAKTGYREPTNPAVTAWQEAHGNDGIDQLFFDWLTSPRPEPQRYLTNFKQWMIGQNDGRAGWLDIYDVQEQLISGFSEDHDAVMFVDVGGAVGNRILDLKKRYPDIPGRMILQDNAGMIARVDKVTSNFEATAHDFHQPQPVQGARCYYLRQIFRDLSDEHSVEILKNTASAMKAGYSKILINEMVIPDRGAGIIPCQTDILMMALFAAKERTESNWRDIIKEAGLEVVKVWTLHEASKSIIEVMLPEALVGV